MSNAKQKVLIICGPTASGKSDVAIKLAQKFNGKIISADSRQIYRQMDIGTGKVPRDASANDGYFSEGIEHHLIDAVNPMEDFNVSHFQKEAKKAIENALNKGKLPIICGGTGFWIKSIVNDTILPDVKPNPILRAQLNILSAQELFAKLQKLDPERANNIDPKNKVRLIRAIEITNELGKVPRLNHESRIMNYDFLQIGIEVPREVLNEKIKKRLDDRFDAGMIQEVEELHKSGVSWQWMEKIGLEYRWIARYLQNKILLEEMKEKLYFDIIHYAKRQMTWLKKDKGVIWLKTYSEIENAVEKFLEK